MPPEVVVDDRGHHPDANRDAPLVEDHGRPAEATVDLPYAPSSVRSLSLMEDEEREIPVTGNRLEISLTEHEIATFLLARE